MGMVGCFRALSKTEIQRVQLDPDAVMELLDSEGGEETYTVDVDKAWQAIHYMLTGTAEAGEAPASLAVLGGTEIGEDIGYGPPRILLPAEVKQVADFLEALPPEAFAQRYAPKAMDAAGVYPEIWVRDGADGLAYILEWYQVLRAFYLDARLRQDGVLLWLG